MPSLQIKETVKVRDIKKKKDGKEPVDKTYFGGYSLDALAIVSLHHGQKLL